MRKKSHIALSRFLVQKASKEEFLLYRKNLYIGSILPDCVPSFFSRRHTIENTLFIVQDQIKYLMEEHKVEQGLNQVFFRKLGIITHYIADYFTFPHNKIFTGSISQHCYYENQLKHRLRECLTNGDIEIQCVKQDEFLTVNDVMEYIIETHENYLKVAKEVETDIEFIVSVCWNVVNAIVRCVEIRTKNQALILNTV